MARETLRQSLQDIQNTPLVEYIKGESTPGQGAGSQIRRRSIKEITTGDHKTMLTTYIPPEATAIAERLRGRSFAYGRDMVTPTFTARKTGRVYVRNPPIQQDSAETRLTRLATELPVGDVIIDVDICQAEPSVIKHLLARDMNIKDVYPSDPYQELATLLSRKRKDVKADFQRMTYHPNSAAAAKAIGIPKDTRLWAYVEALDAYKLHLWQVGKYNRKTGLRRFAHTLGGRKIEALKGENMHKGKPLNWRVQGTVAEIVNAATLEILEREKAEGWTFLLPVHDSVIVRARIEQQADIEDVLRRALLRAGIQATTKTTIQTTTLV
jgi:hypothetical protein